jgi:hypothetical protein
MRCLPPCHVRALRGCGLCVHAVWTLHAYGRTYMHERTPAHALPGLTDGVHGDIGWTSSAVQLTHALQRYMRHVIYVRACVRTCMHAICGYLNLRCVLHGLRIRTLPTGRVPDYGNAHVVVCNLRMRYVMCNI